MIAHQILTENTRLHGGDGSMARTRKVYLYLGPSRAPGKIRIMTWSHATRSWSAPRAVHADLFCDAPQHWPQTKAVRKWIADERAAGRLRV